MTRSTIDLVKNLLNNIDPGEESFNHAKKGSSKHKKLIKIAKSTVDIIDKLYTSYDTLPPKEKEYINKKAQQLVDKFNKKKEKTIDDPSLINKDPMMSQSDSYIEYLKYLENLSESNKLMSYSQFLNERASNKLIDPNLIEINEFILSVKNLSRKIHKHS